MERGKQVAQEAVDTAKETARSRQTSSVRVPSRSQPRRSARPGATLRNPAAQELSMARTTTRRPSRNAQSGEADGVTVYVSDRQSRAVQVIQLDPQTAWSRAIPAGGWSPPRLRLAGAAQRDQR
jgi:hypothetical protein